MNETEKEILQEICSADTKLDATEKAYISGWLAGKRSNKEKETGECTQH